MNRHPTGTRGFTLIEMVVVVSVVLLLSGILIPTVGSVVSDAKKAKAGFELKGMVAAMQRYINNFNNYPTNQNVYGVADPTAHYLQSATAFLNQALKPFVDKPIGPDSWGVPFSYHHHPKTLEPTFVMSSGPNRRDQTWASSLGDGTGRVGDDIWEVFANGMDPPYGRDF
jgi:type II secretion system protein G